MADTVADSVVDTVAGTVVDNFVEAVRRVEDTHLLATWADRCSEDWPIPGSRSVVEHFVGILPKLPAVVGLHQLRIPDRQR